MSNKCGAMVGVLGFSLFFLFFLFFLLFFILFHIVVDLSYLGCRCTKI